MTVPTRGETFQQLIEHVRKAQEHSAMLSHLARANDDIYEADGWLAVSELLKKMGHSVIEIATKGMH